MSSIEAELSGGVMPAGDLRTRLGISPATLMRAVRALGPRVLRIGRGRATRYALRQAWPNLEATRFPLVRIDMDGRPHSAGHLITLAGRQTIWLPAESIANGLPVELADARPSGFLGRHFAAAHDDLPLPARVSDWSDHHILIAMSRRGEDLPGNLLVGDETFGRWQTIVPPAVTRDDYPRIAAATAAGAPPGSSAGGERPKFGALVDGRHYLVKFVARGAAPNSGGDAVTQRWSDLLILEALALDVVRAHDIPAAPATIVETDSHRFLESERFDRIGPRGRRAVLSLAAVHDEAADSWARAARLLRDAGRLSADDARRLQWLDAFGALIGNTDRHHYNIVFFPETESAVLRLAPAYDQASMAYAPTPDGRVPSQPITLPFATADTLDVWDDAQHAAREFWEQAGDDARVSDDVRVVCAAHARTLGQAVR